MDIGTVRKIDIDKEMQQAYLDYAMSVIVARALPDARDGLKPVHRRILYAMHDMNLRPDSPYKKSARIVGEVLGKYHPHGDAAVYEAMARMAQDFSMRYLLVDGQGNFGSVDGDPPAAMRYTEARLAAPAVHLLADIQKNTVNFAPNFDDTLQEPTVLPSAIPNLLVNGAQGIAVGMSTSIPPHNLGEVVDALVYMLENWTKIDDIDVDQLMYFIKGPDFPTGGVILNENTEAGNLKSAYGTGRGRVTIQAKAHMEDMGRGKKRIIVTELPYMTNKSTLIERIAELTREGKLEEISDLRDETDREGMRIVIELSKTDDPESVLRELYKRTPMRTTFSMITLALVNGEPRLLSLKQALKVYLEHRMEVVRRRSEFDLEKARERAHILEGLRIALANLDEVISIIRRSPDADEAKVRLMKKFRLSDVQATAILNMPLRRLASLERQKIEEEYKELVKTIKELEALLASPVKMRQLISKELSEVKAAFADRRKTLIVDMGAGESKAELLTAHDLTNQQVWVSVTPEGLVSRTLDEKPPRISGKSAPAWLLQAFTRDTLHIVAEDGRAAAVAVHALPTAETPAEGTEFHRVCSLSSTSKIAVVFNLPPKERLEAGWFVLSTTLGGMVKKSTLEELPGPSAQPYVLTRVNDGDRLGWVHITRGTQELILCTSLGMAIRFNEEEVRPMGLVAAGVSGIKLSVGDYVVGSSILPEKGDLFMLRMDGQAKRVKLSEFPKQGRYGQGVQAWKSSPAHRLVGMAIGQPTQKAIVHLNKLTAKAIRLDDAPLKSRAANGAVIVELRSDDFVTRLTLLEVYPRPEKDSGPINGGESTTKGATKKTPPKPPKSQSPEEQTVKTEPQETSSEPPVLEKTSASKATPAKKRTNATSSPASQPSSPPPAPRSTPKKATAGSSAATKASPAKSTTSKPEKKTPATRPTSPSRPAAKKAGAEPPSSKESSSPPPPAEKAKKKTGSTAEPKQSPPARPSTRKK